MTTYPLDPFPSPDLVERLKQADQRSELESLLRRHLLLMEEANESVSFQDQVYQITNAIYRIEAAGYRHRAVSMEATLPDVIMRLNDLRTSFTSTGWINLDRLTGGWKQGELTVISTPNLCDPVLLAIVATVYAAQRVGPVLLLTETLRKEALTLRTLNAIARVPVSSWFQENANWSILTKAASIVAHLPIELADDRDAVKFFRNLIWKHSPQPDITVMLLTGPPNPERTAELAREVRRRHTTVIAFYVSEEAPSDTDILESAYLWLHVEGRPRGHVSFRIIYDQFGRAGEAVVPVRAPLPWLSEDNREQNYSDS